MNAILSQAKMKRILVICDVGSDRYTIGAVDRISPEAPVPVVLVEEEKLKLGLAANVADNIKALGADPLLVGVIGGDRGAQDFKALLKMAQIKPAGIVVDRSRRTALKERIVSDRQQIVRIDYESLHSVDRKVESKVLQIFRNLLKTADGVIIEDYAKGILTPCLLQSLFKLTKEAGKLAIVDPNLKNSLKNYQGASILTPNTNETEKLTGILIRDPETLAQAGFSLLKMTRAEHVILTRGKEGMAIFSRGNRMIRIIPTYAREVYDVSGAGDTVIAVLSLALAAGATIEEAAVLGNLAAGIEVGKRGTATVSPEELRVALDYFETVGI